MANGETILRYKSEPGGGEGDFKIPEPVDKRLFMFGRMREQYRERGEEARRTQNRDLHLMQQMPSSHLTHRFDHWQ